MIPDLLQCQVHNICAVSESDVSPPLRPSTRPSIRTLSLKELQALAARPVTPRSAILRSMERARLDKRPVLSLSPADDVLINETAQLAQQCLSTLFPESPSIVPHVRGYLETAHRTASMVFGTAAAVAWGSDFTFPPEFSNAMSPTLFLPVQCCQPLRFAVDR